MKRILCLAGLAMVLSLGMVFAGAEGEKGAAPAAGQSGSSGVINLTLVRIGYNDAQVQMAKSRVSGYYPDDEYWYQARLAIDKNYPQAKVEWVDWGWAEQLDTKQRATIAAGTPPTNVAGEAFFPAYADSGMLQEVPAWVYENLNPNYVFKGRDGKVYGVEYKTSIFMLFYNKNLLKSAGLDPEKPPKTWSEWQSMSKQITAWGKGKYWGGGIPSFPHNGGALRATPFFRQLGVDFGNGDKVYLNDPKVHQVLQFIREMNANFPAGLANGMDENPFWNAFRMPDQQTIGFVVDGAWNQQRSKIAGLNDVGIADLPLPDKGGQVGNCQVGAMWIGVPKGVPKEHADLFWKIFVEVSLKEDILKLFIDTNYSPGLKTLLDFQSKMTNPDALSGRVAASTLLNSPVTGQAAFYKNNGQVWEILCQQVLARTTMSNTPIPQICSEAQARIEPLLK
jgi:multiple sugar transport system substrate-binding protein